MKLKFDDYVSDWVPITNSIGQGNPLLMLLYIIYTSDLVDVANRLNELTLAFVDDMAFIAIGKMFQETHVILTDMLEHEGGGYQWSKNHNSHFEPSKFALIDFSLNRKKARPLLHTRNVVINPTPSHKFLGVFLDQELWWWEQANYALAKGTQYTLLMRHISGTSWGTPMHFTQQLYQALVVPRVTYAASIWLCPVYKHDSDTPQCGSLGVAKRLARIQHMVAITILGAMRTSPADTLDLHAFLPPTPILLQEVLHQSIAHMAMLPASHPLHPKIKWIEKHNMRRHKSALHHLIHSLDIHPSEMETINPYPTRPSATPPMTTSIASTKEGALEEHRRITSNTIIYTDGSCTNGQVGVAAVLYVDGQQVSTLCYHLGPTDTHMVFEAEMVGLILAAHFLSTSHETSLPATILVDNQAAIQAGERPTAKSGHYLCLYFRNILRKVLSTNNATRKDIMVQWIAGHRDVEGNKATDAEAKRAALDKNTTSLLPDLPKCLCTKLPIGTSAVKQKHRAKLMALWKCQWSRSKRFTHLSCIDLSAPSKNFMRAIGYLPKSQAGTMYQLHSGHIALNKHLHRINSSDTPLCLQCEANIPETVHHLLFKCTCYSRECHILRNKLGREALSTSHLLVDKDGIRETLKFVRAMNRLWNLSGEGPSAH